MLPSVSTVGAMVMRAISEQAVEIAVTMSSRRTHGRYRTEVRRLRQTVSVWRQPRVREV